MQLTGRFNYRRYGELLDLPLEDNPLMAGEPLVSLKIACVYWKDRNINPDCDHDDLISVTKKVNGGLIGLTERREYYRRAKIALSKRKGLFVANDQGTRTPVIQRGSFGNSVAILQKKLRVNGFDLTIDADFGPATDLAVRQFQAREGLMVDGIVGAQTWNKLG